MVKEISKADRSWEFLKISLAVVRRDKELILMPVLGVLAIPIIVLFLYTADMGSEEMGNLLLASVVFACILTAPIFVFLRAAQMLGAKCRLEGGNPTIRSSVFAALKKFWPIFGWAILTISIRLILAIPAYIAKQLGGDFAGYALGRFLAIVWNVFSYLALPIAAFEGLGPLKALRRSRELLHKTWGESLAINVSVEVMMSFFVAPGFLVMLVLIPINAQLGAFIALGWYVLVLCFMSMISAVYQTALYIYAATGKEPTEFAGILEGSFSKAGNKLKTG